MLCFYDARRYFEQVRIGEADRDIHWKQKRSFNNPCVGRLLLRIASLMACGCIGTGCHQTKRIA
jgi:hypothetical protein